MEECKFCNGLIQINEVYCPQCQKVKYTQEEKNLAHALGINTGILHTCLRSQHLNLVKKGV